MKYINQQAWSFFCTYATTTYCTSCT